AVASVRTSTPLRRWRSWRQFLRPALLLVLGGLALYVSFPTLLSVFRSWRSLSHLDWPFAVLTLAAELLSFFCLWELDRVALGTDDRLAVIAAQLVGDAAR